MPSFFCMHCGQRIEADDARAGSAANCPACGGAIHVPGATVATKPAMPPRVIAADPVVPAGERAVAARSPDHADGDPLNSAEADAPAKPARWSPLPLIGTVAAIAVVVIMAANGRSALAEILRINRHGTSVSMGAMLGGFVLIAGIAVTIGLVIATCALGWKKPFARTFPPVYAIAVILVAGWRLTAGGTAPAPEVRTEYRKPGGALRRERLEEERKKAGEAVAGIKSDIDRILKETTNADGTPRDSAFRFEDTGADLTDPTQIRAIMQKMMNEMLVLQADYHAAIDRSGVTRLLVADRIANDAGMVESKKIMRQVHAIIADFRGRSADLLKRLPQYIEQVNLPSHLRDSAIEAYRKSVVNTIPVFQEMWDLEAASAEHMDELVAHLERTRARWQPIDGKFIFDWPTDSDRFNAIMAKIEHVVKRQVKIRESAAKNAKSSFDAIDLPGDPGAGGAKPGDSGRRSTRAAKGFLAP